MKSLFLTISLLACCAFLSAQHNNELYINGANFFVSTGTTLEVVGDMHCIGGTLTNNGTISVQGNLYSDNTFQQRGIGTVRLYNKDVNTTETQFISGSFAVRGGTGQIGVDDGSFYNLDLANSQGIVWLNGSGNVADVRNSVNFDPSFVSGVSANRIITNDPSALPANGSAYSATFGLMNTGSGLTNLTNNIISTSGSNIPSTDNAYIQGKFRRAIASGGGDYGFVVGLEPAGSGAQHGVQYVTFNIASGNSYDVIESYFESGSDNSNTMFVECTHEIDYFGGIDHGEWIISDISGSGAGNYTVTVYPQDDNFSNETTWLVTKDDTVQGTVDDCWGNPVGASKSGLDGFSEFGLAGGSVVNLLPLDDLHLSVRIQPERFLLEWYVEEELSYTHFELQRSEDGITFQTIAHLDKNGKTYNHLDKEVDEGQTYYYRAIGHKNGGHTKYSNTVYAKLPGDDLPFFLEAVFPNPSNDKFNLIIHASKRSKFEVKLVNILGQPVITQSRELKKGSVMFSLNVSQLASGPYFIQIHSLYYSKTVKVLIQR